MEKDLNYRSIDEFLDDIKNIVKKLNRKSNKVDIDGLILDLQARLKSFLLDNNINIDFNDKKILDILFKSFLIDAKFIKAYLSVIDDKVNFNKFLSNLLNLSKQDKDRKFLKENKVISENTMDNNGKILYSILFGSKSNFLKSPDLGIRLENSLFINKFSNIFINLMNFEIINESLIYNNLISYFVIHKELPAFYFIDYGKNVANIENFLINFLNNIYLPKENFNELNNKIKNNIKKYLIDDIKSIEYKDILDPEKFFSSIYFWYIFKSLYYLHSVEKNFSKYNEIVNYEIEGFLYDSKSGKYFIDVDFLLGDFFKKSGTNSIISDTNDNILEVMWAFEDIQLLNKMYNGNLKEEFLVKNNMDNYLYIFKFMKEILNGNKDDFYLKDLFKKSIIQGIFINNSNLIEYLYALDNEEYMEYYIDSVIGINEEEIEYIESLDSEERNIFLKELILEDFEDEKEYILRYIDNLFKDKFIDKIVDKYFDKFKNFYNDPKHNSEYLNEYFDLVENLSNIV